jgi:hypothetical protein
MLGVSLTLTLVNMAILVIANPDSMELHRSKV